MTSQPLLPVSGYVLAGGRSSRMGTDKALLQLGGQPLAARAVARLATICQRVRIVGSQPELAAFAPTVPDNFPGCGPLGGLEAALSDSPHDWLFTLPVDLPFVPPSLLSQWAADHLRCATPATCIAYLEAGGYPQPLVALLHRSLLPQVQAAMRAGQYRILDLYQHVLYQQVAQQGAEEAAEAHGATGSPQASQRVQRAILRDNGHLQHPSGAVIPWVPTPHDIASQNLWFSNLNTPEEAAEAESYLRETAVES